MDGRCADAVADGAAKTVRRLAVARAAAGGPVAVFAAGDGEADPLPGVAVVQLARGRPGVAALPPGLERALRAFAPDVVHLHGATVPWCLRLARRLGADGLPYAVSLHGNLAAPLIARAPWRKRLHRLVQVGPVLDGAAFLHSVGDGGDARALGLTASVVEARNGVDRARPDAARDRARVRWRTRLGSGRHFVVLGRLAVEHKGLDLVIAAWSAARPPSGRLVIAGPGDIAVRRRLARLAARAGVAGSVLLPGPVYGVERDALLAAADGVIQPSRWEAGLCHTVLEAASLARPLLVTAPVDRTGHLRAAAGAVVVEPSETALADGLAAMAAAEPETLAALGERARSVVARAFRWSSADARIAEAYAEAVAASSGPRTESRTIRLGAAGRRALSSDPALAG